MQSPSKFSLSAVVVVAAAVEKARRLPFVVGAEGDQAARIASSCLTQICWGRPKASRLVAVALPAWAVLQTQPTADLAALVVQLRLGQPCSCVRRVAPWVMEALPPQAAQERRRLQGSGIAVQALPHRPRALLAMRAGALFWVALVEVLVAASQQLTRHLLGALVAAT